MMSFKNNFILILIIIGILLLSACNVFADSSDLDYVKVTVDGVDFNLNPNTKIIKEENDLVSFQLNSKVKGYITSVTDQEINKYTHNDSDYYYIVGKIDDSSNEDYYLFIDENDHHGHFLLFEKDNKKFIYEIYTQGKYDDPSLDSMIISKYQFKLANDISSINHKEGKSFKECKKSFPEASNTVLKHVFDESDSNGDGYLSNSEFKTFEDVKRFTKEYANVKNEEYVETPDLWNGDGTTRTRYCADHGRVAVGDDNKCPWCIKYGYDPRTRADSTKYV